MYQIELIIKNKRYLINVYSEERFAHNHPIKKYQAEGLLHYTNTLVGYHFSDITLVILHSFSYVFFMMWKRCVAKRQTFINQLCHAILCFHKFIKYLLVSMI
jgi:hypothetical protein